MTQIETTSLPENAYQPLKPGECYPPIVPADTWLARQLPAGVGVAYHDVQEIPALVGQIAADYGRCAQASLDFAPAWRARHNAAALVAMLASFH